MSREIIIADLIRTDARQLKMPGLARAFETLARQARSEKWSHEEYLHELLQAEIVSRNDSAVRSRIANARFPETKTLGEFDFAATEGVDAELMTTLARGEWIARGDTVLFAGPIGTGKTHLAIALAVEAARQRRHVAFWRAADLVRTLIEARDKRELGRLQARLRRVDLVVLDEVGFVPFDRAGGELLFNMLADRYERRRAVAITTNLSFSEWPRVFADDEKLTTALLDRLAERATIITTRGKSYRMRRRTSARAKYGSPTSAATGTAMTAATGRSTSAASTSRRSATGWMRS
jgi:DNA replication protein DnaC